MLWKPRWGQHPQLSSFSLAVLKEVSRVPWGSGFKGAYMGYMGIYRVLGGAYMGYKRIYRVLGGASMGYMGTYRMVFPKLSVPFWSFLE